MPNLLTTLFIDEYLTCSFQAGGISWGAGPAVPAHIWPGADSEHVQAVRFPYQLPVHRPRSHRRVSLLDRGTHQRYQGSRICSCSVCTSLPKQCAQRLGVCCFLSEEKIKTLLWYESNHVSVLKSKISLELYMVYLWGWCLIAVNLWYVLFRLIVIMLILLNS